jgi:hypothetical protein
MHMLRIDPPNYDKLPENFREPVRRYIEDGKRPGGALCAILANNLLDATCRLQPDLLSHLKDIVLWFHWEVPALCWGSPERVKTWLDHNGCRGLSETGEVLSDGDQELSLEQQATAVRKQVSHQFGIITPGQETILGAVKIARRST